LGISAARISTREAVSFAVEPEERDESRLEGSLVIWVSALSSLLGISAARISTREAVSFAVVRRSIRSEPETGAAKAAPIAFSEFAWFKISDVSPFWLARRAVDRIVERNTTPIFVFIVL
jgi:hypothetical protein